MGEKEKKNDRGGGEEHPSLKVVRKRRKGQPCRGQKEKVRSKKEVKNGKKGEKAGGTKSISVKKTWREKK